MQLSEATKVRTGVAAVLGLGVGLVGLHLVHARSAGEDFQTILVGILVPMSFALAIVAGGYWLGRKNLDGQDVVRIAGWCWFGTLVLALAAVLTILYQYAEGVQMSDRLFILVNGASGGAVVGFVIGIYDVRQRSAREEADQLSRQLTVLNRVLRHDIRNNANVIQGNAELLTNGSTEPGDPVFRIKQQALDLVELGEHAKEIERLLHGTDAERKSVDITALVENHCECMRQTYPDAVIECSVPDSLFVRAHPLVDSALRNVIDNAVEHNDKETPRVEAEVDRVVVDGTDSVELRIADNGPGIPESELAVLDRGYETALGHTSGLGLWLVNWIVEKSDGDVQFETNDPEGTVVRLRFERADERDGAAVTSSQVGRIVSSISDETRV